MAKKKRAISKNAGTAKGGFLQSRTSVTRKNLFLYFLLFVASFVLYYFSSSSSLLAYLFGLLSFIFGFVTFAFLIVLVVLSILKPKKR